MKKLYFLFSLAFMTTAAFAQHNVTFQVDMKNETVGGNVYLAGSFNSWSSTANQLTQVGTSTIYSATISVTAGHHEYKFLNGAGWEGNLPDECSVGGGYGADNNNGNRWLEVWSDTTLPAFLFNGCAPDGMASIQFMVDMKQEATISDTVSVAGSFQGWSPGSTIMADVAGDSIYRAMAYVNVDDTIYYKFVNGTAWGADESVPSTCAFSNNRRSIASSNVNEGPYCFGMCTACPAAPISQFSMTFMVDMQNFLICDSLDWVDVAGSLNGWGGDTLHSMGNGIYARTLMVDSGEVKFKFRSQPGDGYESGPDRIFVLSKDDTVKACFSVPGFGSYCTPNPTEADLTFRVDMAQWGGAIDTGGVYIMGDFTNWQDGGIKMNPIGGGIYELVLADFCPGELYYRFVNGKPDKNDASGEEANIDSTCGKYDDFSGKYNRYFKRPDANDYTLQFIFDECTMIDISVDEFANENVILSPNPFKDYAVVSLAESGNYNINIYDMTGRMVKVLENVSGQVTIERDGLLSGVYIMMITNENGITNSSKFIVE